MKVVFLAPSTSFPVGGTTALYEFAGALARRGHDVVLAHIGIAGWEAPALEEITWHTFEPSIEHTYGLDKLPEADRIVCCDDRVVPGETVGLVQQWGGFTPEADQRIVNRAHLKLCTSTWLREITLEHGRPPAEVLPYGLWHDRYRIHTPYAHRRHVVGMLWNPHLLKGSDIAISASAKVHANRDDVEFVMFGALPAPRRLPPWIRYWENPSQETIVEIYNQCRVWVQASVLEGFGLTPVEAMACGATIVSTDCGGSRDYAFDGLTARIVPPRDRDALADAIAWALDHPDDAQMLAEAGTRHVEQYDWDRSGEILEQLLYAYQ